MDNQATEFITVQDAADRLKVSRWTVYQLMWDCQLQSVKVRGCRRIIRQSLDAYITDLIDEAA